jgi:hypothetical protein
VPPVGSVLDPQPRLSTSKSASEVKQPYWGAARFGEAGCRVGRKLEQAPSAG